MRRADRLFQIIQILRRSNRPVTAAALAEELEVSTRTVYRDTAELIGCSVPILGEAGFGYVLAEEYNMPPLMLTRDELEAVTLGAQWVADRADNVIAQAARDVIAKISSAVPERLRCFVVESSVGAKPAPYAEDERIDCALLRAAIRQGRKLRLRYRSDENEITDRIVRPLLLGYADSYRMLIVWCELREGFRHFRTDRIVNVVMLDETIGEPAVALRRRWEAWRLAEIAAPQHLHKV
ncbi:YafY family protein [Beijerinckia sp. L45]|uniref:helix-turn-helix transcriptional regulator n=1 Tax=Beijerinckia sp. L45 TaxID=1641855 RepID=UPI00131CD13D|nr:YafY family protein [Beijerinckia sp. L45]